MTSDREKVSPFWYLIPLTLFLAFALYALSLGKFVLDQGNAVALGYDTLAKSFIVTHGKASFTLGVYFTPNFAYLMGFLVSVTDDPQVMSGFILLLVVIGYAISCRLFHTTLPPGYAMAAAVLLAINPLFIIESHDLWEPTPMIPFMALAHIFLARFVTSGSPKDFIVASAFITVCAQFFLVGFFFYPLLAIIGLTRIKTLKLTGVISAILVTLLLSAPYLYYLIGEGGFHREYALVTQKMNSGTATSVEKLADAAYWNFRWLTGGASYYMFEGYLPKALDFLLSITGKAGYAIYFLALLPSVALLVGVGRYIVLAISKRSFFSTEAKDIEIMPVSVQLAAFLTIGLFLLLVTVKAPAAYHYMIALFPSYAIITAWMFWRFKDFLIWRVLFHSTIFSMIVMLTAMFAVNHSTGHWIQGGLAFDGLRKIADDAWKITPDGKKPMTVIGDVGLYQLNVAYMVNVGRETKGKESHFVGLFSAPSSNGLVTWKVVDLDNEFDRYGITLDDLVARVESGATIVADNLFNERGHSFVADPDLAYPDPDTPYMRLSKAGIKVTPFNDHESAIKSSPDYIVVSLNDPRMPFRGFREMERQRAKKLLIEKRYGLANVDDNILIFKKGVSKELDSAVYPDIANYYLAHEAPSIIKDGVSTVADSDTPYKRYRRVANQGGVKGHALFGPGVNLAPGNYVAEFKVKVDEAGAGKLFTIDVSGDEGRKIVTTRSVAAGDIPNLGEWGKFELPFSVAAKPLEKAEFRLYLDGAALRIDIDRVTLRSDYETFMMNNINTMP